MTGVLRPSNDLQRVRENATMGQLLPLIVAAVAIALLTPAGAQDKPEMPKLRLAVGGKSAIFYLPLSITERLGYFRDAGLDVEIADVQSGARALQSLVRGECRDWGRHLRSHHSDAVPRASRSLPSRNTDAILDSSSALLHPSPSPIAGLRA